MSVTHNSLIEALASADMLEIDGLYAWQFNLDNELLAQVSAGSASSDSQNQPLLTLECIDGRDRRHWSFSLSQISAAKFDGQTDSWTISNGEGEHHLKCFAAISGNNDDDDDDAVDE
ncbi:MULTISPECIES: DUF5629 family protein [Pseudomonas]|uniref:DUF5629 family protein n=1 Tax=Pseudomonas TaxID=286 RepID=UPI0008F313DA|nr:MULTISPECIES: DUF5629 family protein [Pseudomonas]NRH28649.1 hypothetical protein [Pseudomonas sp. MS19]SFU12772.1 hypothetical protein SAMN05216264_11367 [Pseudomonas marincola]